MNPPGKSYIDMLMLTLKNHRSPGMPFTPQLLMAIFWEESLFNNMRQVGRNGGFGPAIGFGQVERQELDKLGTQKAQEKGYYVPGVNRTTTIVSDDISVQIASCMLLHLYHASSATNSAGKVNFALRGYSGNRQAIIDRWKACERRLLELPFSLYKIINYEKPLLDFEDKVMDALTLSRPFNRNANVQVNKNGVRTTVKFRQVLFPRYWFFSPIQQVEKKQFITSPQSVKWGSNGTHVNTLQSMLNALTELDKEKPLKVDGIFGQKTYNRVIDFQKFAKLKRDGIVGRNTKANLA